jgi:signal peptidase II
MFFRIAILILLDQITKAIFVSRDFFLGPIKFILVKNYGLPFGINSSGTVSMIVVVVCLTVLIAYALKQKDKLDRWDNLGMVLILSGAISNIVDRIVLGYVRDFADLGWGFVFNLADVLIVLGLAVLVVRTTKNSNAGTA